MIVYRCAITPRDRFGQEDKKSVLHLVVPRVKALLMLAMLLLPMLAGGQELVRTIENDLLGPVAATAQGAAAVVVLDGQIALMRTWGVRAAEGGAVDRQTLFRLASISKTFAGTAGALLVRDSDLKWDSPIAEHVKGLRFKQPAFGAKINLQHVLSQSTGLMPHAYTNLIEDNMSYGRILTRLDKVDFICQPGECYSYQNVVFSLVGEVVKQKVGIDYARFVTERIFSPLKMSRASIGYDAYVSDKNHAKPHVWNGKSWRETATSPVYYRVPPAAGVNASIEDMSLWLLAHLGQGPDVFPVGLLEEVQAGVMPTSRHQAHYPRNPRLGDVQYGLGWRVFEYADLGGFVHHGGYVRGMRSEMVFNRELNAGLVFLTNSEPRKLGDIVFGFLDLLFAHKLEQAVAASAIGD